jgi:hypothetical protein
MFCKSSSPRPSALSGCWKPVLQRGHPACPAYATLKNKVERVEPSPATVPETCTTWHPNMSLDKHTKIKTAVGCTDKWRLRMWACEHLDDSCDSCTILIWFLSCHHVLHESPHEEGVKPPWHGLPQGVWSCGTLWAPANLINAYQRSVI